MVNRKGPKGDGLIMTKVATASPHIGGKVHVEEAGSPHCFSTTDQQI